ncbi:MAG: 2-oxoglutarate dehydrogenase complex dihydrolipoyllysine-residue succinyltransferase [Gammaproteobacteria bacterium]
MTVEVKVPVLAESIAEANLLKWHKKVGETVKRGDNLIDIETDKVTLEVAAPNSGVLIEILKQDGEEVKSDEIIGRIGTEKQSSVEAPSSVDTIEDKPETSQPKSTKPEDAVPQQQTLLESEQPEPVKSQLEPTQQPHSIPGEKTPKVSPAVRNLLSENKLQTSDIKTHKDPDRITKEDVLNHLGAALSTDASKIKPQEAALDSKRKATDITESSRSDAQTPALENIDPEKQPQKVEATPTHVTNIGEEQRPQERAPMTRLRKRIAKRLLSAQHDNALLTTFNEVNMRPVVDLRHRYKEEFEKTHEIKLGFMSFFTRATVEALKKFPLINASVEGEDILYRGYFDIGIAVSSPRGLVVPVLRDADTLSFAAIETRIAKFGQKAKEGKLTIEDLTGGTFTITNGGVFGSLLSTPIINPPQSAILGMHKIQDRPVAENSEVVIRPMMYLALTYDHRIIDGREAVQFLVSIKEQIEDPSRLLLQI